MCASMANRKLSRMATALYISVSLIVALTLLLFAFAAAQVEDWRRDLTTNYAATAEDAADERLRPLQTKLAPAEFAERVAAAAQSLKNWRLESSEEASGTIELHFVRTTPVLRFRDDI